MPQRSVDLNLQALVHEALREKGIEPRNCAGTRLEIAGEGADTGFAYVLGSEGGSVKGVVRVDLRPSVEARAAKALGTGVYQREEGPRHFVLLLDQRHVPVSEHRRGEQIKQYLLELVENVPGNGIDGWTAAKWVHNINWCITRDDILKPKGAVFGLGDLVQVTFTSTEFNLHCSLALAEPHELWRVMSFAEGEGDAAEIPKRCNIVNVRTAKKITNVHPAHLTAVEEEAS